MISNLFSFLRTTLAAYEHGRLAVFVFAFFRSGNFQPTFVVPQP